MKKVLLVGNHEIVIYNFRKELIERLISEGYEVYISLPYGKKVDILKDKGAKFIDTPMYLNGRAKNPAADLLLIRRYKKMLKRLRPDIVLTYTIKPNLYCALACGSLGIPQIANITGLGTAVEYPGISQLLTLTMYKIMFKNVTSVFVQNKENENFLKCKGILNGQSKLLPGSGVNLQQFCLRDYPAEGNINFLYSGRILKEKGIDQYLEAADIIKRKYENVQFTVIGECSPKYREKIKDYDISGIIDYHGMQSDVIPFLAQSHCFINPTYYPEGISNVLLEAGATGRPVIAANRSGCRETVIHGVNGYLFEPQNTQMLIEQIERFISLSYEQKRQMGLESRKKVEREFDRELVVNAYLEEIERLIGSGFTFSKNQLSGMILRHRE
ncbi:MAG: glycosyltransferase family 4 protein [Chitinispirillales bacterium]|jgi:galacturonosyltransferase|nr:glycosyltransferase family 4 protein [Chitinispirillales bacterium]